MTIFRRAALIACFTFIPALPALAQEQTLRPSGETVRVTAARDKVHVSIGRDLYATQVEVSNSSGEIIYESGMLSGDSFDWGLRNSLGERVAAGDYTLTITYRTPAGKLMRRTEQVSVQDDGATAQESVAEPPSPTAVGTITGEGTSGKIAKFNGTNSITNSAILTESTGKLLVNGALELGAASGTGVNPTIVNPKNIPNFALVRFYPASGTNVNTSFTVVPRGTGQPNNRAQFSITNTDAIADPSNVEFAALTVTGNVCAANISCASDARLKQNVTNLKYGLDQLLRLRPVSWRWKSEPEGTPQMGLVAQEVEKVLPELVLKDADATKPLGLNYMALLPVAVKAIQEQQAQIQRQQKQIERLQARLARLERDAKRRQHVGRTRSRR